MKDLFGNKKPVKLEADEWWFNGRIIQKQDHPLLSKYVSFDDHDDNWETVSHGTLKEATDYCLKNPCQKPKNLPKDYGV